MRLRLLKSGEDISLPDFYNRHYTEWINQKWGSIYNPEYFGYEVSSSAKIRQTWRTEIGERAFIHYFRQILVPTENLEFTHEIGE